MLLVEARHRRSVRDGHQRGVRQPLLQDVVQLVLGLRIEAGGRLVQEDPVRLRQQRAGQRDALLLAARQALRPVVVMIQTIGQLRQPGIGQRLARSAASLNASTAFG